MNGLSLSRPHLVVLVAIAAAAGACSTDAPPRESGPTGEEVSGVATVCAVNYPLAYFAERIGGRAVEVEYPIPDDVDPAFWVPDAESVGVYQHADVILLNGAGYARWTDYVSLPTSRLVVTSAAFSDRFMAVSGTATHAHGPGGEHEHAGTAFTTWIDLSQAAAQAQAVRDALAASSRVRKDDLDRSFERLRNDLLALDGVLLRMTDGHSTLPLLASHPVYDYFARRYRLNIASVLWEPDEVPDESAWDRLAALRERHPASWMIWEGEPRRETVERLEKMGIRSVVFDPCGSRPGDGDFLAVMRANVANLRPVFERARAQPADPAATESP